MDAVPAVTRAINGVGSVVAVGAGGGARHFPTYNYYFSIQFSQLNAVRFITETSFGNRLKPGASGQKTLNINA